MTVSATAGDLVFGPLTFGSTTTFSAFGALSAPRPCQAAAGVYQP